jgi:AbrB family looped-hinge helix DNA binding protein
MLKLSPAFGPPGRHGYASVQRIERRCLGGKLSGQSRPFVKTQACRRFFRKGFPMSTVTAKGQLILDKELLKHLGVQPGEKILVEKLPDGRIELKAARPTGRISDVFDVFKREKSRPLSIEQISEIARRRWAGGR